MSAQPNTLWFLGREFLLCKLFKLEVMYKEHLCRAFLPSKWTKTPASHSEAVGSPRSGLGITAPITELTHEDPLTSQPFSLLLYLFTALSIHPLCALWQEEVIVLFLVFNKIWKAFKCLTKWLETRKQKDVLASCNVCMKSIDTNTLNAHTVKQDYKESMN